MENPILEGTRSRAKLACLNCRKSKIRCSGTFPSCDQCLKKGRECVYDVNKVVVRRNRSEECRILISKLQMEIYAQKCIAEYWKRKFHQIIPHASIPKTPIKNNVLLFSLMKLNANVPPYEYIPLSYDILFLMNTIKDYSVYLNTESVDLEFENVQSEWNLLALTIHPPNGFDHYSFSDLVHLWERCNIFMGPCLYCPLPYQKYVLWQNASSLMKKILYGKELTMYPQYLHTIVSVLLNMDRYYRFIDQYGAKNSCLLLAYHLASSASEWIPPRLMDTLKIELISASITPEERVRWLSKLQFESADPFLNLKYIMAYSMSALTVSKEVDFKTCSDVLNRLKEAEKIAMETIQSSVNILTQCRTHILRAEIAYRQGFPDLAQEWIDVCFESLLNLNDFETIRIVHSTIFAFKKETERIPGKVFNERLTEDLLLRIEAHWPELVAKTYEKDALIRNLFYSAIRSPQKNYVKYLTSSI